jgi:hypothetical protein
MSKNLTQEYIESSDYDKIIHYQKGYTLGIGYCYVKQMNDMNLFQDQNLKYYFFQTKWGYCGNNFLFSALKPDNIIILSAWANSAATCGRTEKLFYIWYHILNNILSMDIPIMMIDMPAAFHKCIKDDKPISLSQVADRRMQYREKILKDFYYRNNYIDIYDYVPSDWPLIHENHDDKTYESPWHVKNNLIKYIFQHFLNFTHNTFDKTDFTSKLTTLNP